MITLAEKKRTNQTLLNGALILSLASLIVKVIGVIYKIPLSNMIGTVGRGYFDSAYNLYVPIYTVSMAGLPVAISNMVSKAMAMGNYRDVKIIRKVAGRLFLTVGIIGTVAMFILAFPYALSAKNMDVLPAVFVITPSIFFCCIMSSYRGYYNGLSNMTPTAISEVFEAAGKLVFGLICAKAVITYGYSRFEQGLTVFGRTVTNESEALSAIYPYAAAGAVFAVTLGTVFALLFMVIHKKIKGDTFDRTMLVNSPRPKSSTDTAKTMITALCRIKHTSIRT